MLSSHAVAGRGPRELSAAISAGVSVHRTRQTTVLWCWGRIRPSAEPWPEADGPCSAWAAPTVCGFVARNCNAGAVMAEFSPADGWRPGHNRLGEEVAGRILRGDSSPGELRQVVVRKLLVASVRPISGSAYQVAGDVALQVARKPGGQASSDPWPCLAGALGPAGGSRTRPLNRLDIRAATLGQRSSKSAEVQITGLPSLHVAGQHSCSIPARDQVKRCNGVALSPKA